MGWFQLSQPIWNLFSGQRVGFQLLEPVGGCFGTLWSRFCLWYFQFAQPFRRFGFLCWCCCCCCFFFFLRRNLQPGLDLFFSLKPVESFAFLVQRPEFLQPIGDLDLSIQAGGDVHEPHLFVAHLRKGFGDTHGYGDSFQPLEPFGFLIDRQGVWIIGQPLDGDLLLFEKTLRAKELHGAVIFRIDVLSAFQVAVSFFLPALQP